MLRREERLVVAPCWHARSQDHDFRGCVGYGRSTVNSVLQISLFAQDKVAICKAETPMQSAKATMHTLTAYFG